MPDTKKGPGGNGEDTKDQQQPVPASHDDKDDLPKSKSYAEILKGFEEIEKIFKHDQAKDK